MNEAYYSKQLKDATRAIWVFIAINISVLVLHLLGESVLAVVMVVVQLIAIALWLLPMLAYKWLYQKLPFRVAICGTLSSYRSIFSYLSW